MAKLGVNLPNYGIGPVRPGLEIMALACDEAGVGTLHLSDHLAFVDGATSPYPFSPDGVLAGDAKNNIFESLACSAWALAVTQRVHVGPSVMVLTQRQPLEVAKAAATIDRLSGGRLFLGVGAGWLAEETRALGWTWEDRGARLDEAIDVIRLAWSGSGDGFEGDHFRFPKGVHSRPLPHQSRPGIPLYVGGMSPAALTRAARKGDGWIAAAYPYEFGGLREQLVFLDEQLAAAGRGRAGFDVILRVLNDETTSSADIPEHAVAAARLGVDQVVVDPMWEAAAQGGRRDSPDVTAAVEVLHRCAEAVDRG
jgi:probable F420-dependent oxidoreductase